MRALLAWMLALIAVQATPAAPLPVVLDNGSAFSASSRDVALSVRREPVASIRVVPLPPVLPGVEEPVALPVCAATPCWSAYDPAAPLRGPPRRSLPSPREPPKS